MGIASARDWIIVIVGVLEILFLIGAVVILLIIYSKINKLVKQGKMTIEKIEKTVTSPYFKAGAWIFRTVAVVLSVFDKRQKKEE
jgi:hypothetical protein